MNTLNGKGASIHYGAERLLFFGQWQYGANCEILANFELLPLSTVSCDYRYDLVCGGASGIE